MLLPRHASEHCKGFVCGPVECEAAGACLLSMAASCRTGDVFGGARSQNRKQALQVDGFFRARLSGGSQSFVLGHFGSHRSTSSVIIDWLGAPGMSGHDLASCRQQVVRRCDGATSVITQLNLGLNQPTVWRLSAGGDDGGGSNTAVSAEGNLATQQESPAASQPGRA